MLHFLTATPLNSHSYGILHSSKLNLSPLKKKYAYTHQKKEALSIPHLDIAHIFSPIFLEVELICFLIEKTITHSAPKDLLFFYFFASSFRAHLPRGRGTGCK